MRALFGVLTASVFLCWLLLVAGRYWRMLECTGRHLGKVIGTGVGFAPPRPGRLFLDHDLEAAENHAPGVEGECRAVHHARQALVLHDLGNDAITMRAGFV